MTTLLESLSNELATAVEVGGRAVVAIHARRRIPASGVHWRQGVIVATNHTINRDENITVTLPDGTTAPVTLAGRDPSTDLAVLRLAGQSLATAHLRLDPSPSVGEFVIALGRPGPRLTASWGVVSSVAGAWRTWRGGEIDSLLRLDVSIYDGFSGGPLIDAAGRVLGINSSGLARGTAVAIPVATVERTVGELLERGTIRRAYLGIGTQPVRVPQSLARRLELKNTVGLLIASVEPGGPADRDGVLLGDVLLALDGADVSDPTDVLAQLGGDRVGRPIAALELEPRTAAAVAQVRGAPPLRVGELVIAIGHPGELTGAATLGIVHMASGDRAGRTPPWIRADLRLAPGFSGGPLADARGRLIGINTLMHGGMALAVPAALVQSWLRRARAPA